MQIHVMGCRYFICISFSLVVYVSYANTCHGFDAFHICISLSLVVSVLYANIGHGMFVIYRRNLSKVWMCFTCFKGWMCFIWKYFWWGGCVSYVNICHGLDVFHTQRLVMW